MPTRTGNPSQYSKDQLKNLLISHNVALPQGDQRKAVYLQLYLKHILPKDEEAADFSSDDEDMWSENDLQPVGDHEEKRSDKMDLKSLSDSEIKEQLRKHGVNPGPILPTTRAIYERKLQQLLEEKQLKENGGGHEDQYSDSEDEGVQVKNLTDVRCELNGDGGNKTLGCDNYSQNNVLTDHNVSASRRSSLPSRPATLPPAGPYTHIPACIAAEINKNLAALGVDFSVTKMLKQMERRPPLSQTTDCRNGQENKNLTSKSQEKVTADKITMTYRAPANTPKACVFTKPSRLQAMTSPPAMTDDASPDDFSDLLCQSALGMSATRRKPIKGAAGRPIQFRYDDIVTRARMQEQTKTVTEGKPQRLLSVRLQIVIFLIVAFVVLVYITMESSPENPFDTATEDLADVQQP
ncbi:LEM domain-containing protein 1 isoform X2 [Ranitomeya variabilis]|uniref:LEM domain-containing protein 1 isoform X2 n=1 Tax=Ranitomeya variabilis TaxID=490064 RepID=UPI0040566225